MRALPILGGITGAFALAHVASIINLYQATRESDHEAPLVMAKYTLSMITPLMGLLLLALGIAAHIKRKIIGRGESIFYSSVVCIGAASIASHYLIIRSYK